MMQSKTRMSTIAFAVKMVVAATAFGVMGAASAAADTTRVIVAFKPGKAAKRCKSRHRSPPQKASVKHEIFGMDAMAIEVPPMA